VLHSRYPETAKPNDAGTQKRGGVQIVQRGGKRKYKVSPGKCILGVSTVHGVAREGGRIAKVFQAVLTIPALPINAAYPGNPYSGAQRKNWRSAFGDFANDLVARNQFFTKLWKLALRDMQIGPADTTRAYLEENLPWLG